MTSVLYAMYGGRISSILLNIPGDEPAMMTTLDGYPMAKRKSLMPWYFQVYRLLWSFSCYYRTNAFSTNLTRVAFYFGPAEYFALYLLAFCTLGGIGAEKSSEISNCCMLRLGISMIGVIIQLG